MVILHIEHAVPSFEGWKKAFEADPIGRKRSGVHRYRVYRSVSEPNYVVVDLEFNDLADAEATLIALKKLWEKVEGSVMMKPQTRIMELIESTEL